MAKTGHSFGLRKGLIAPWVSQTSWGTAIQLEVLRQATITFRHTGGALEGDDKESALAAIRVGGSVSLAFGLASLDAVAAMSGLTVVNGGAGSDELTFIWQPNGYFGLAIQSYLEDATGAKDLFIPKCKLMGDLVFNPQYGQFWSQTVEVRFIDNEGTYGFGKLITRATASTLTIPPA